MGSHVAQWKRPILGLLGRETRQHGVFFPTLLALSVKCDSKQSYRLLPWPRCYPYNCPLFLDAPWNLLWETTMEDTISCKLRVCTASWQLPMCYINAAQTGGHCNREDQSMPLSVYILESRLVSTTFTLFLV